jgi:hypothetical protein
MNIKFIEILQDGAALIEKKQQVAGVYTEELQTCIFLIFIGSKRDLFIHDSGQLSVNSIKNSIDKCGAIEQVYSIENALYMKESPDNLYIHNHGPKGENYRREQLKKHRERLKEIYRKSGINIPAKFVSVSSETLAVSRTGEIFQGIKLEPILEGVSNIPEKRLRRAIIKLNNAFQAHNSQSIKVDIQHKDNSYTDCISLAKSPTEMKSFAEAKARAGDRDYLFFLTEARDNGVPGLIT